MNSPTTSPSPSDEARRLLDGFISVATEGFVVVAEEAALRPHDEQLRRTFESNLTRLDRLLAVREKLARHADAVSAPSAGGQSFGSLF